MLCARCQKNEATLHFTIVVEGKEQETVHLCKGCAPATGLGGLDLKQLQAMSVIGKKCAFCGRTAASGVLDAGSPVYWCFDCGLEFGRILADLRLSERPDLMQQSKEAVSFLSICSAPGFQAWSEAANRKAVQLLRERRRQDGRDKSS